MIGLYSPRPLKRQSFKGVKPVTLPNQSMSLRTIIQRFTRNEMLEVNSQEGYYDETLGVDLEKMQHLDLFDMHELYIANRAKLEAMEKEKLSKAEAKKKAEYDAMIEKHVQERLSKLKDQPPAAT